MRIIIAPDSFKGSMTAVEAAKSIEKGVLRAFPEAETIMLPVGDGGEGTLDTLVAVTNGHTVSFTVKGPLENIVEASYGVLGDEKTCIIEMSKASGIGLVPKSQLNPLKATTYGTGELIKKALDDGYKSFILALGGSATNDGGAGMLQALGMKLLDKNGEEIGLGGSELNRIASIDKSNFDLRIAESDFLIASDVQNPLIGADGASHVFGPQKGASPEDAEYLDKCLKRFADVIEKETRIHLHNLPGSGAAGGIGGAFQVFFPSEMRRGIDVVIEHTKLNQLVEGADLVITGEGKVDFQTVSGKTPMGIAQAALSKNVPTIILAGSVGKGIESLYQYGVVSIHSLINEPMKLNDAINRSCELTELAAEQIVRTFFYRRNSKSY